MNAEQIAQRFGRLNGFELIDYSEVALPLWRLTVDAVTRVHRLIPPIKEFVMRSIDAGFSTPQEIAGFLGMDPATISATVGQLRDDRYAIVAEDETGIVLLDKGREVLARERESSPQDETLVFLFDGILRRPVWLGAEPLLTPSEIDPASVIEIRPYPAALPEVDDLKLPDVLQVLRKENGSAYPNKDLLRLKRVVRRVRLFRRGVALLFKKLRSPEVQIMFFVDGARNEALEHAFTEKGGLKKMGFIKSIDESLTASAIKRHLGSEITTLLPDAQELEDKRIKVSTARLRYEVAKKQAERIDGLSRQNGEVRKNVEAALALVSEAEKALKDFAARPAAVWEIPELLTGALRGTVRFLAISTHEVRPNVVDTIFLRDLELALQRKVNVVLTIAPLLLGRTRTAEQGPYAELDKLARRYSNLSIKLTQQSEFYHLIQDDDFALICNRGLLGIRGKAKTFHHFAGYLLQRSDLVKAYTERVTRSSLGKAQDD